MECHGEEIEGLPANWLSSDIQALEDAGFLIRESYWKDPGEPDHTRTSYKVRKT
jgi:DNA-binding HxlR family transcriptional regulator